MHLPPRVQVNGPECKPMAETAGNAVCVLSMGTHGSFIVEGFFHPYCYRLNPSFLHGFWGPKVFEIYFLTAKLLDPQKMCSRNAIFIIVIARISTMHGYFPRYVFLLICFCLPSPARSFLYVLKDPFILLKDSKDHPLQSTLMIRMAEGNFYLHRTLPTIQNWSRVNLQQFVSVCGK